MQTSTAAPAEVAATEGVGSRSQPEPVICGDGQLGMIADVSLRLLYLIFSGLLSSLTLLGRTSASMDIELVVLRHEGVVLRRTNSSPACASQFNTRASIR
jgi:hypothetical protein